MIQPLRRSKILLGTGGNILLPGSMYRRGWPSIGTSPKPLHFTLKTLKGLSNLRQQCAEVTGSPKNVTWTPKTDPALMRASLSARLGQEKPHETQTPQPRADHPQAAQCRATAQPRPNSCRCMPSSGGICCHLPPLVASLRRHEIHGSQAAQGARTGELSTEAFTCRGRARQGHAQRACCAVRRTLRCDGKLLSPERRRRAVVVLQGRFRASQRRACRLAGQNRSTQRRPVPVADIEEHKLRQRIRELARRHIRWGRRLVYRRLRIEGWSVNHKRVQRIWREEGLQRPLPRKQKRSRPADGTRELLRAEYPHHVWAIDFQFDQTMDGRRLKFLNIVDEYSRMCLAIRIGRRCKAMDVIDTIEELLKQYPAPTHLRMDNGPEFIAHALQEWCTGSGSGAEYIPPGSPWENPFVESFKSRLRDEFLIIEIFASLLEAKVLAEQHRMEYNTYRPHSALQGRTPLEVLQQWKAA